MSSILLGDLLAYMKGAISHRTINSTVPGTRKRLKMILKLNKSETLTLDAPERLYTPDMVKVNSRWRTPEEPRAICQYHRARQRPFQKPNGFRCDSEARTGPG